MTTTESLTVDASRSASRSKRPWCLFQSGPSAYAISLETVAEVVEIERLVRVPHTPPRIVGLCTLRREVIPVVELGEAVLAPSEDVFSTKMIVLFLRTTRGTWAVRVDAEGTMVTEESMDAFTREGVSASGPKGTRIGTLKRGNVSYSVIDPEATWHDIRRSVENWYQGNQGVERADGQEIPSRTI